LLCSHAKVMEGGCRLPACLLWCPAVGTVCIHLAGRQGAAVCVSSVVWRREGASLPLHCLALPARAASRVSTLAQEDDQTKEAKQHQLLEEDIDAILARAEVRAASGARPQGSLLPVHPNSGAVTAT